MIKVKILTRDLISRYGGVFIDMNLSLAMRLQEQGKVKIINAEKSSLNVVDLLENVEKQILNFVKFPGVNDSLFPKEIISR